MKVVRKLARVDFAKCTGCGICRSVCPVLAIDIQQNKACVDGELCQACANCEQRCPQNAVTIVPREEPLTIGVDTADVPREEIERICQAAGFHPEQVICYCLRTRAEEVAAAIIKGASTPEEISRATGVRTGCAVLCIQSVLRLLKGAGITPRRPPGFQWYGKPITLWDIPEEVKKKYAGLGFHLDDDKEIMAGVPEAKKGGKRGV